MLRRLRWDDQGGYPHYLGDGKWNVLGSSLPVSPTELNALFEWVGIVPEVIVPRGECAHCQHAILGHERGYVEPCCSCKRPQMSNFVLRITKTKKRGRSASQ